MLADSRTPIGGLVNSGGLEPALQGGMPADRARAYLHGRLRTVAEIEAAVAVVTRAVALERDPAEWASAVAEIEDEWAARTPSPAQRASSRLLARGLQRMAGAVWPSAFLAFLAPIAPSRGVVVGAVAAATGMPADAAVRLVLYDEAQAVVAALLKLAPMDPLVTASWAFEACAAAEPRVARLTEITEPSAIPANGCPQSEEWAESHAATTRRLFRA
ncbi:urease accessory protein UreF [Microbacterium sp. ASV81]|uniref:Urease accessory UreF family protein n=1 Tax=Microbacterium capsulatum TaxID=3041921 RepID=A0ABU0XHR5_9MICO|nr:urease accessory UreF family protein [Microbacterium sp. ASV81]MDQ4214658.1 urease accessory UreF family protein [Microbacterium sp. ASV81]